MTSRLLRKFFQYFNHPASIKRYWTASISNTNKAVILKHAKSGDQLLFPATWLRDNCLCSSCFNKDIQSRLIKYKEFQYFIQPKSVSCSKNESEEFVLEVKWPDNHKSVYPLNWLEAHSFEERRQKVWLKNNYSFEPCTWDANTFDKIIRYFQFDQILANDEVLLKYLITLNRWGIAIIRNAGYDQSCVEQLGDRIGYLKQTTYGKIFIVAAKEDATNAAYLSTGLQLHTDLPYYEYKPSCNFLHCIRQSPGEDEGVNQLVDGFAVCQQLKNYDVRMFNVLADTPVEWVHIGKEGSNDLHHVYRAPVICQNVTGDVERINFSQPQRGSQFCVSVEQANAWYKSLNWFVNLMYHPRNVVRLKMEEGCTTFYSYLRDKGGNILTFANARVLHGRSAFTKGRTLIGGYMDWDVVNSKTRVLLNKFECSNIDNVN